MDLRGIVHTDTGLAGFVVTEGMTFTASARMQKHYTQCTMEAHTENVQVFLGLKYYDNEGAFLSSDIQLWETTIDLPAGTYDIYTDWYLASVDLTVPAYAKYAAVSIDSTQGAFRSYFDDVHLVRTDIDTPVQTTPANLIQNPDGNNGTWFWTSDAVGTVLTTGTDSVGSYLQADSTGGSAGATYTTALCRVAGDYVGARVEVISSTTDVTLRIAFFDLDGNYLSSTPASTSTTDGLLRVSEYPVPSGALFAAVRLTQSSTGTSTYRQAMLATDDDNTLVDSSMAYAEYGVWEDILNDSSEINITREELDVGTLNARVWGADLDPAVSERIRPGNRIRLQTLVDGNWVSVYTGRMTDASVKYGRTKTDISLSAVDNIAPLSGYSEWQGVDAINDLPYILEGKGTPWNVNGSGSQIASATVVASNTNASALDQVAITRDSNLGYAWVDRNNTLQVWDRDLIDTTVKAEFSDAAGLSYSAIDATFNTQTCINEVTIKYLRYDEAAGTTEEIDYGPYRDQDSIDNWGVFTQTFTIQGGTEDPVAIADYAGEILTANGTPIYRVNSLEFPVRDDTYLAAAVIDLYDRVGILYKDKLGKRQRVTGVRHSITPQKWMVTLNFEELGSVASPRFTPSPSAFGTSGTSGGGGVVSDVRIGPLDSQHIDIDADGIYSKSDADTVSPLSLNPSGETAVNDLVVTGDIDSASGPLSLNPAGSVSIDDLQGNDGSFTDLGVTNLLTVDSVSAGDIDATSISTDSLHVDGYSVQGLPLMPAPQRGYLYPPGSIRIGNTSFSRPTGDTPLVINAAQPLMVQWVLSVRIQCNSGSNGGVGRALMDWEQRMYTGDSVSQIGGWGGTLVVSNGASGTGSLYLQIYTMTGACIIGVGTTIFSVKVALGDYNDDVDLRMAAAQIVPIAWASQYEAGAT